MWNVTPFCYKYIQVTACKKLAYLTLSLIKLLQKEQGCNFFCLTVYYYNMNGIKYSDCYSPAVRDS